MSDSLWPHGLYSPWSSPGQNTGVGILSLLQGIFPIQGSNPGLPHCRQILFQLSHGGSPRVLELVAYPFSSGYFQPTGNWTGVPCIAGTFFTNNLKLRNPLSSRSSRVCQPVRPVLAILWRPLGTFLQKARSGRVFGRSLSTRHPPGVEWTPPPDPMAWPEAPTNTIWD